MVRRTKIAILLFLMGVACHVAYYLIGSHVDENGVLVEPFPLIPIGYLFYIGSIIYWLLAVFLSFIRRQ